MFVLTGNRVSPGRHSRGNIALKLGERMVFRIFRTPVAQKTVGRIKICRPSTFLHCILKTYSFNCVRVANVLNGFGNIFKKLFFFLFFFEKVC